MQSLTPVSPPPPPPSLHPPSAHSSQQKLRVKSEAPLQRCVQLLSEWNVSVRTKRKQVVKFSSLHGETAT